MLIDTHTHLVDEKFPDLDEIIKKARMASVEKLIVPTTSLNNLDEAIAKLTGRENIYLLAGVHPEEIDSFGMVKDLILTMKKRIEGNKQVVGIGEIGLDFYYDKEKRTEARQRELFGAQLEMALELNLPVAIHMREAETECLKILGAMKKRPRGQFHCFAGSEEFLEQILAWGFYVSLAGNVTYKSAQSLRDRLKNVPIKRLLVETDSPYLAPEPLRGTVNEPANVKILAEYISRELGLTFEEVSLATTQNAICLYSLEN